jgi:hypothetical protein
MSEKLSFFFLKLLALLFKNKTSYFSLQSCVLRISFYETKERRDYLIEFNFLGRERQKKSFFFKRLLFKRVALGTAMFFGTRVSKMAQIDIFEMSSVSNISFLKVFCFRRTLNRSFLKKRKRVRIRICRLCLPRRFLSTKDSNDYSSTSHCLSFF